jgi:hypothetical protein
MSRFISIVVLMAMLAMAIGFTSQSKFVNSAIVQQNQQQMKMQSVAAAFDFDLLSNANIKNDPGKIVAQ